jgi:sporulation protein YlmC with PRC-barrel domain
MKFNSISRLGAVAILSLSIAGGLRADDDAEVKAKIGDAEGKASVNLPDSDDKDALGQRNRDRDRDRLNARAELKSDAATTVTKVHKASSLTGMNVMNHQNEKLGDIKDIVLDLPSGKISYVVLSVGGFLGIGDKLIAVPPSAFTFSANRDALLLDADKARIESAPGFVQTAWPDVNDPQFGAYWRTDKDDAVGGTSSTEIRSRSSDRENKSDLNRDLDKPATRDQD